MKILNLTVDITKKLTAHRDAITEAANVIVKSNRALNTLLEQQGALTTEISKLETSAKPGDRPAVQSLSESRTELEIVQRRIKELPVVDVTAEDEVRNLLRQAARLVADALLPTEEAFVAEVAKAVRPFHQDDAWAAHTARQTPAVAALMARTRPNFSLGNVVLEAQRVQRVCDEILSGELNWSFDPKLS